MCHLASALPVAGSLANPAAARAPAQLARWERMKSCTVRASKRALEGRPRHDMMTSFLSGKSERTALTIVCDSEATAHELTSYGGRTHLTSSRKEG